LQDVLQFGELPVLVQPMQAAILLQSRDTLLLETLELTIAGSIWHVQLPKDI